MGTRSLTTVIRKGTYEDEKTKEIKNYKVKIVTMYRQMDGYPSGMGLDLANFLDGGTLVNGIGLAETRRIFNGAGCLAAQMVADFKEGAGGIYLHRGGTVNCWEDYRYEIICNEDDETITFVCKTVGYMSKSRNKWISNRTKTLFTGQAEDYKAWLEEYETQEA